jgi:hypothetical protein
MWRDLEAQREQQTPLSIPFFHIVDSVAGLAKNKAPGPDGVLNEHLLALRWPVLCKIHELFEHRLNCGDPGLLVHSWVNVHVFAIPKIESPKSLSQWRPISLISVLAKLFGAALARLCDECVCWPDWVYGFRAGRQVMEISACVRHGLSKAARWEVPLCVAKIDVRKAFDSMLHDEIYKACVHLRLPAALTQAIVREHARTVMTVQVNDFASDGIPLQSGGRQGGRDTPTIWNLLLVALLDATFAKWSSRGAYTWELDGTKLNAMVWADDIILFAPTKAMLEYKVMDLLAALNKGGLTFKSDSLEWICDAACSFLDKTLRSRTLRATNTPSFISRI